MLAEVIATPVASHALMSPGSFPAAACALPASPGDPLSYSNASVSQFTARCMNTHWVFFFPWDQFSETVSEEVCCLLRGL